MRPKTLWTRILLSPNGLPIADLDNISDSVNRQSCSVSPRSFTMAPHHSEEQLR